MTTPAPNPRSTPPPGTYEAWRLGCRCAPEGAWVWAVDAWRETLGLSVSLPVTRTTATPPPHKPGCVLAKERP